MEKGKAAAKDKGIDLFIHSNGGSGTVPWRIVSLIREYTDKFAVLVPHRAFSAATLIAMGADEIVMHRMGCLGPIDPSVANIFNPPNPRVPGQVAPISVEDVSAYFKLVQDEMGITHQDELIQAFMALADKVHPLALGNVQRSHSQARMLATKLLKQHMSAETQEHEISKIIDTLKSNLFYHGHPINRKEAVRDLALKILEASDPLEGLMWSLYLEYEKETKANEIFNPIHEIENAAADTPPAEEITTEQILGQLGTMAQAGLGVGTRGVSEEQLIRMAAAMHQTVNRASNESNKTVLKEIIGAFVQSEDLSHVFHTDLKIERATINAPGGPQDAIKQEVQWQRWITEE